jgi:hypothetical protein
VIGANLSSRHTVMGSAVAAFIVAFLGRAALWWLDCDRSAEASAPDRGVE